LFQQTVYTKNKVAFGEAKIKISYAYRHKPEPSCSLTTIGLFAAMIAAIPRRKAKGDEHACITMAPDPEDEFYRLK
jgi:hypothetical protein